MGEGKQLYDQRKRLKMENDIRMEQSFLDRQKREAEADALVDLGMKALRQFLDGKASLVITGGNREGEQVVYFQMSTT